DDYGFRLQVCRTGRRCFRPRPQNLLGGISAPDPRTVVIRWKPPYPEADALSQSELPPLPRHLLEASFVRDSPDAFMSQPFWTREFVGLGPYQVDRWEPGAFIDATAFDAHVLGRPKIDRLHIVWTSDPNTADRKSTRLNSSHGSI